MSRLRMHVRVESVRGGTQWSPGGKQSNEYRLIDLLTGERYIFDSHAEWPRGSERWISATVRPHTKDREAPWIHNPRPIKPCEQDAKEKR